MKTLTVREVPDTVYAVLKEEASVQGRSLQAQIRWILEKETRLRRGGFLNAARQWQRKLSAADLGHTVDDIRTGRERR